MAEIYKNNQKITSVSKDVRETETLVTLVHCWWDCKWCNHNENYLIVPKKLNGNLHMIQQNPLIYVYIQRKLLIQGIKNTSADLCS